MIQLCGFAVSNYYNKLKLVMLEKAIPFEEVLTYPWQRDSYASSSPLGKIPFIKTDEGDLSESQVILDYLEERHPAVPLYPASPIERAKCRELIQHLELNCEWVARRLYKECFFGGQVSDETKTQAHERLVAGLQATEKLAVFGPYVFGSRFTAADCVAYVHFLMISLATEKIYADNLLDRYMPQARGYMQMMERRPHIQTMLADRAAAMAAFIRTGVKYDG